MLDPPETASNLAKGAKELGLDPIVTAVVMAAGTLISFFAWLVGERGGKKVSEGEADITAALIRHDEQKAIARLAEDMNKAVVLLVDMTKILSAMDRGQRETHILLESIFTALELTAPMHRKHRSGEDAG